MKNIQDYIEIYGKKTFEEVPFNDVDSLVLCNLSYQILDAFIPNLDNPKYKKTEDVFLKDIVNDTNTLNFIIRDTLDTPKNKKFLLTLIKTKRFNNLRLNYFKSVFNKESETQFAAMVFKLDFNVNYVAFRGTDITILGWKEDFNMALLSEIPSQTLAVQYLDTVIPLLDGQIYVGGHSKGGNLARYGSIYCNKHNQKCITKVFDHDGPGMQKDLSNEPGYILIKDRISKTVPHDSLVGILLKHDYNFKIIKCKSVSIIQHDPYSWNVDLFNGDFIYMDERTFISQINDLAINKWIDQLNDEQRKVVIECIFKLFKESNINTVKDMVKFPLTSVYHVLITMTGFNKEEKRMCMEAIVELLKAWKETIGLKLSIKKA